MDPTTYGIWCFDDKGADLGWLKDGNGILFSTQSRGVAVAQMGEYPKAARVMVFGPDGSPQYIERDD